MNVVITRGMCNALLEMMDSVGLDQMEGTVFLDPVISNYCEVRFRTVGDQVVPPDMIELQLRPTDSNRVPGLILHDSRNPDLRGWTGRRGTVVRVDHRMGPEEKGEVL